jgi:hypothetical protein
VRKRKPRKNDIEKKGKRPGRKKRKNNKKNRGKTNT